MSTKVPHSSKFSRSSVIPSFKHFAATYKNPSALTWRIHPRLYFFPQCSASFVPKRVTWLIGSSVDDKGMNFPPENGGFGTPRLLRAIQAFQSKLTTRIEELKNGLPMKLLCFLVGFYCATAFATVIGQTGDWDVLSAAVAVIVVEAIGALTYKASIPLVEKMRSLISMFNYWKAGLTLGLFLDAFKYEFDSPFVLELDIFSLCL